VTGVKQLLDAGRAEEAAPKVAQGKALFAKTTAQADSIAEMQQTMAAARWPRHRPMASAAAPS
jgi:hypothetical protein